MPPKNRKSTAKQALVHSGKNASINEESAVSASSSGDVLYDRADRGLLLLPVELRTEILDDFPAIGPCTQTPHSDPVLPKCYLERTDVLRTLSQVSVAYRRAFLSLLWESLNICCAARPSENHESRPKGSFDRPTGSFYKHIGQTLLDKCDGLATNPGLSSYVRRANVVLTRFKASVVVPRFSSSLEMFNNLHTLHVLHAHTQMTTAIKDGFKGVTLPQIRTLIIPGYCHELLKCCPRVKSVWCIRDDGSKLITVMAKFCKEVEELRGFRVDADEKLLKRAIKAVPNLTTIAIRGTHADGTFFTNLPLFKKLNTLIIKVPMEPIAAMSSQEQKYINDAKICFKKLPKSKERRYICLWHGPWTWSFEPPHWSEQDRTFEPPPKDYYNLIDLE